MVFAPAVGIACCQVLAAMFGFIAVLLVILGGKNWFTGADGMAPAQAFLFAAAFVGGALACLWFARLIQRMSRGG